MRNLPGELREEQITEVEKLLQNDNGILNEATAFGKTVVCCKIIAKRQVSTLILLQSSALLEYWQGLQERMRKVGFEIKLAEDYCRHYCIIDRQAVWYGSMNFLGKEDAEDNLMRVADGKIANELLEMTFGNERCQGGRQCKRTEIKKVFAKI